VRLGQIGRGLVGLGIITLLVWVLLKFLWILGVLLILAGTLAYAVGLVKKHSRR
jgi:hypothetical protein